MANNSQFLLRLVFPVLLEFNTMVFKVFFERERIYVTLDIATTKCRGNLAT